MCYFRLVITFANSLGPDHVCYCRLLITFANSLDPDPYQQACYMHRLFQAKRKLSANAVLVGNHDSALMMLYHNYMTAVS